MPEITDQPVGSARRTLLIDLDGTLTDPKPGITIVSAMPSNGWDTPRHPPMTSSGVSARLCWTIFGNSCRALARKQLAKPLPSTGSVSVMWAFMRTLSMKAPKRFLRPCRISTGGCSSPPPSRTSMPGRSWRISNWTAISMVSTARSWTEFALTSGTCWAICWRNKIWPAPNA